MNAANLDGVRSDAGQDLVDALESVPSTFLADMTRAATAGIERFTSSAGSVSAQLRAGSADPLVSAGLWPGPGS